jgi:HPt (histidine-containing phosphotransfer) domain-containing protein
LARKERDLNEQSGVEIINEMALNNIRQVENQTGKSILPSLIDGYEQQMRTKLSELSEELDRKDSIAVYKIAHAIKSMSANIGAEKVRSISATIEIKSKENELSFALDMTPALHNAFQEFLNEISSRFERKYLAQ